MHDQAVLGILTHEGFGHVHQDAVVKLELRLSLAIIFKSLVTLGIFGNLNLASLS